MVSRSIDPVFHAPPPPTTHDQLTAAHILTEIGGDWRTGCYNIYGHSNPCWTQTSQSQCCGHGQCSGQYDRYTQHCDCDAGWSGARCNIGTVPAPPPPPPPPAPAPSSCSGLVELDLAQSFGDSYTHNADCQWRLTCPSGNTVHLEFSSFDVENNFDYVNIYDGSSTGSTELGEYTGTATPSATESSGRYMLVRLTSDGSVSREGFSASYSCVAAPPPNVDCAGSWSLCTSSCEAGAARTWSETTAQSGTGAACPSPSDCQPGDGECPAPPPPLVEHPCFDIDGSGSIGIDDFLAVLQAFGGPVAALNVYDGLEHADNVGIDDLLHLLPDFGRDSDLSNGCVDPVVGESDDYLNPVVTTTGSAAGYTTYMLTASLHANTAANLYSIEGTPDGTMEIPAAFQVATPFGANVGGVMASMQTSVPDSWLTVGITDDCNTGVLSSLGIDFESWSETTGLSVDNGAVYWLFPDAAPGGDVAVAQLTVPSGSSGTVKMGMQGHATGGGDWNVREVTFEYPPTESVHEGPHEHPCMDM